MILKSLYLKNFLIHEETKIDFSEKGITVFIGENGAGKSSILEGLTYALFGKSDKGNQANLVKWGRNQAVVSLEFQKGKEIFNIERTINVKGNRASSTGIVYQKKGDRYIPYYQKNITKEIPKLTGISNKIFSSSILVKQGDIEGLLRLSPKERAKVLEEILDMTLYQLLSEKAGEKRRQLETKKETLEASLTNIDDVDKEIAEKEKKLKQLKEEKKKLEKIIENKKKNKEELQSNLEKLLLEKSKQENIRKQIQSLKEQIESYREEIKRTEEVLKEINEKQSQLQKIEEEIKDLNKLESILKDFEKLDRLEEKYAFLKEKLNEIQEKKDIYEKLKGIKEIYTQKEQEYSQLIEQLNQLSKLSGELKSIEKQIENLKETRKNTLEKGIKLAKELQKYKRIYKTLELNPVIINEFLRGNKETIDFLQKKKEELLTKLSELETIGKQLKKEINQLESLEGTCPTCRRPIEEHTKEELLQELSKELEEKRAEYKKIKEEIKQIEERIKLEKTLTPILEEFKNNYEKHTEVDKEIQKLKSQIFVIKDKLKNKESLEKEKKELEEYLKQNKDNYQLFVEAERFLSSIDVERIKTEFEKLEREIKEIKEKIKDFSKEEILESYEELKRLEKKYIALKEFISQKEKFLNGLERYKSNIEKVQKQIGNLQKQIVDSEFDKEIDNLKKQLFNLEKEISQETNNLIVLTEQIGNLEKEIQMLKNELEKNRKLEEDIKSISQKIEKYKTIEFALGPKGIQRIIRENALYRLPKIVNLIFSFFEFPFQQIKFSENFDIQLLVPTVERKDRYIDINAVSGGQRVALGLALRIAISRFLSNRASFLILDEPTVHLDTQRRNDLINILIDLKEKNLVNQLILVTHDTEIEDAADTIYYVEDGKVRLVK